MTDTDFQRQHFGGTDRLNNIEQRLGDIETFDNGGSITAPSGTDITLATGTTDRVTISHSDGTVSLEGDGTTTKKQQLKFAVTSAAAPGVIDYKENLFGTPSVADPSVYFGINQDASGNLVTTGEPGLSWCVEGDYDDGTGTHKMEAYLQYQDADRSGGIRPIFIQLSRPLTASGTAQTTGFALSGGDVRISADAQESDGGATRVQVKPNNINLFPNTGVAPVSGTKILQLNASGSANGTQFYMGFGSTVDSLRFQTDSTTESEIRVNSKVLARLYHVGSGSAVALSVGGVDDSNQVLLVDSANRGDATAATFVARAASSQTADIIQAQQHTSNTVLFAVTAAGLPKWTAAANQQTTVGAAGAADALPATPTKYLMVVDSSGTTLVVPAYAAS